MLKNQSKPLLFLYIIFIYVLAFSLWWAYLLYNKNELSFNEMVDLKSISYAKENHVTNEAFLQSSDYHKIWDKYNRQRKMVLSEGAFFMVILIIGFLFVRASLKKELTLADRQKNFLLSITHELKSPLASIKLVLETLLKRTLSEESKAKFLNNSLYDVERLESLIENILIATKFENDTYGFVREELDLSYLLGLLKAKYEMNTKKNIQYKFIIDEEVYIKGDKIGLTSVFVNLIENAIKYSDEDTTITIQLKKTANNCQFIISDEGVGIPNEEKQKIFDKFYRIGNEETRKAKGTGLGLYIVNNIVKYHEGSIEILDNQPKGTKFIITFNTLN